MSGSGALDHIFLNTLKYFFKVDNPYITAKYQAKISFGIRITAQLSVTCRVAFTNGVVKLIPVWLQAGTGFSAELGQKLDF